MKPLLASKPAKWRTLLFAPTLLGLVLVLFLVLGFITDAFLPSLVVALAAGAAGAVVLLGWPEVRKKDGSPLVAPRWKPFLFFPSALLIGIVLYPIVGALLTQAKLPAQLIAYVALAICVLAACVTSYVLFGFPHVIHAARNAYAMVPPDRRSSLFFPLFVLLFFIIFISLGVGTTQAMSKVDDQDLLLNIQVLVLLPLSLALAGLGAYLLVGIPKPQKSPKEYLPAVTGRHRPWAFALTFIVLGIPLTVALGALLTWLAGRTQSFPEGLVLPLSILLGFMLSLGIAALVWGTPARWRQFEDYRPGIPERARLPLYLGTGVLVALVVTVVFGLTGADIFWGLLTGTILGVIVALQLAGIMALIAQRRNQPTLVPDMPDGLKPIIFFPAWLLLAGILFATTTYVLPDIVHWNFLLSLVLSLALLLFLVEQPLLVDILADRRRQKEKRKAWEARRQERLAQELSDAESKGG